MDRSRSRFQSSSHPFQEFNCTCTYYISLPIIDRRNSFTRPPLDKTTPSTRPPSLAFSRKIKLGIHNWRNMAKTLQSSRHSLPGPTTNRIIRPHQSRTLHRSRKRRNFQMGRPHPTNNARHFGRCCFGTSIQSGSSASFAIC